MWTDLFSALALLFVLEGIMPFLNPAGLRHTLRVVSELDDSVLRTAGFISMILGLILLYGVRA